MNNSSPENSLKDKISQLLPLEAVAYLSTYIETHPEDDEAYTLRGMKYWSLNLRKEAINDYLTAININPQSSAKMALDYANSILDYYNKDLLNP